MSEKATEKPLVTPRTMAPEWAAYVDIIDLPHHVSTRHPRMSTEDRANQFAPFAALTGYGKVIAQAEKESG